MGQAQSGEEASVGWVQESLQKHAKELKQVVSLSYETFLQTIQELNDVSHSFADVNGKQLMFLIKKGSDDSMLWKGTVRIRCHKVNCRTGCIESTRVMNLKQYVHLYNEITQQANMANLQSQDSANTLCASVILSEFDNHLEGTPCSDEEECIICMDRKAEIILACSHAYCEQCIDEWNVNNKTCPICRARVESKDDKWVLTEKPDQNEMAYETTGYLFGLVDRTGVPSKSPQD